MLIQTMDVQTSPKNLRQEVSCSVCSDIYADPKQLPCLHSFCLQCLKHWHETGSGGDSIKCPKCQTLSRVPTSGDLKDLPTSFYLKGMIDVLAIKKCNNTQVTCGNCDKKSFDCSYCFQCCVFYCEHCVTAHNIMRACREHHVLDVKEFQDKDYDDVLTRPAFCPRPRHEREDLKYFCKNCKVAVCQTCCSLEHAGHVVTHIEDETERQMTEIQNIVKTQRLNLQDKKTLVRQLDEDYIKVVQHGDKMKENVQGFVQTLMEAIEYKRQSVLTLVETQTNKTLETLTTTKAKVENEIEVVELILGETDKVVTRGTNADVIQLKNSLETIFDQVGTQTQPTESGPKDLLAPRLVVNKTLLNVVQSEQIGFLETLGYKPVLTFGKQGSAIGMFNRPWGVAVSDTDEIAVTDCWNHRVQIFDSSENYLRSFGQKGRKRGKFTCPYGITFHRNRYIFVADSGNNRVQILNMEGIIVGMFGGKGNRDSQLYNPCGLSVDSNENIIVADSGNKLIKIFSTDGEFVRKIGGPGSFSFPVHCVQCDEYLIVSDHSEHCIKVMDREGNLQYKFGTQGGGDGELNSPCFLSVTKSGLLMVCDKNNQRIQLFELNGKFLGNFGTEGTSLGEFNGPRSAAILRNGRIVVSDCGNNRIQIFE